MATRNKMYGEYFSKNEMTRSGTAKRCRLDNTPDAKVEANLEVLCSNILDPLRKIWGKPIIVGSGYRAKEVNAKVGGATNSDHMYGCAADIHALGDDPKDNKKLFDLAVRLMKYEVIKNVKQIIDEYDYNWIHISFQDGRTDKRNQVLHLK